VVGLAGLVLGGLAVAQVPTSRSQLLLQNNQTFFLNGQGQISGAAANSLLGNVIASAVLWLTDLGSGVLTALGFGVNTPGGLETIGSPIPIASLPTCSAASVGIPALVNNGVIAPVYNAAVSATGPTIIPVVCTFNGTSYGWTYH
jgi:hypothetical protein